MRRVVERRQSSSRFWTVSLLALSTGLGWVSYSTAAIPKHLPPGYAPKPAPLVFRNWGIANKENHSHIDAIDAWKIEEGSRNVVVAVIDTGIDANHPDLAPNLWHDPSSKSVYGYDFVKNKPNPTDEHGHGTHVAGIIGAIANPAVGISGVAHKVSIMPIRYYSESNPGSVNLANTVKALEWAIEHGAKIINYSGGGPEFSESEYLAMKKAEVKGVLVVAAAGNERSNTDKIENYYYPAAYRLSNIISVAATDINNHLLPSSNWGKVRVDVAAPGEGIYSTLPGKRYGMMTGTSQATAFVTGIAALMLAKNPNLRPEQIRDLIIHSVDKIATLRDKVSAGGRVNAYQALIAMGPRIRPEVTPVRISTPLKLSSNTESLSRSFAKATK